VFWSVGEVPACPPPAQATDHETVAVTVNASLGWPAEEVVKVWPQVGEGRLGTSAAPYGVPGPWQTNEVPSPKFQVTEIGVAVAVTDSPGTAAAAVVACHPAWPSHSHVGSPMSWSVFVAGDVSIWMFGRMS
jgi:hypothetical protein